MIAKIEPIQDDPRPPLDVDTSPIPGESLKVWRRSQVSDGGRTPHPSQQEVAVGFGVDQKTVARWESSEVPEWHAALFREWAKSGGNLSVPRRSATPSEVATLCIALGGYRKFADAIGARPRLAREWLGTCGEGGAPVASAAGPLVAWLVQDMKLEIVDSFTRPDVGLKRGY